MLKKLFKDYFTFSASERNGIMLLLFLIIIFLLMPYFYGLIWYHEKDDQIDPKFDKEVALFESSLKLAKDTILPYGKEKKYSLYTFDPNVIQENELLKMGIEKKLVKSLINYRSKRKFHEKKDLLKLYGMDSAKFGLLEPYVSIPTNLTTNTYKNHKHVVSIVEINTADSLSLISLPGIGPVFAHRIIAYRHLLGGFYDIGQIREVYGISDSIFIIFSQYLNVDSTLVRKMDLNSILPTELKRHPYINKYEVTALLKYRSLKKNKIHIDELCHDKIISVRTYEKLLPYLKSN